MHYTKSELLNMATIDNGVSKHPYGELKEDTDKKRVWFDPNSCEVTIEKFDFGNGEGWQCEDSYVAADD